MNDQAVYRKLAKIDRDVREYHAARAESRDFQIQVLKGEIDASTRDAPCELCGGEIPAERRQYGGAYCSIRCRSKAARIRRMTNDGDWGALAR